MHVPGAFSLRGRGRIGDPAAGSERLGGKTRPLPDNDSVTDERGFPTARYSSRPRSDEARLDYRTKLGVSITETVQSGRILKRCSG